jgi:hypothetical protein
MKANIINIQWDQDNLPTSLTIEVPNELTNTHDIEVYIDEEISNVVGHPHNGFTLDIRNSTM